MDTAPLATLYVWPDRSALLALHAGAGDPMAQLVSELRPALEAWREGQLLVLSPAIRVAVVAVGQVAGITPGDEVHEL